MTKNLTNTNSKTSLNTLILLYSILITAIKLLLVGFRIFEEDIFEKNLNKQSLLVKEMIFYTHHRIYQ